MQTTSIPTFFKQYWTVNYFNFSGRARRKEYWWILLLNILILSALSIIDVILWPSLGTDGLLATLYSLLTFIPNLAISIRRLHDIGRSGWWLLLYFLPIIGWLVLLIFSLTNSTPGDNQWGPNPKGVKMITYADNTTPPASV